MSKQPLPEMNDFSIDLETLGTRCTAPILSIGVQQFDIDTVRMGAKLYIEVDIDSAIRAGRVQADTVTWWITQNKDAQRVFAESENKKHLATALAELTTWMRSKSFAPRVWGNGATFDIGILEYAYDHGAVGLKEPWHFKNIRDIRTLVETATSLRGFDRSVVKSVGTSHNALDDATYQAHLACAAWVFIGKGGKVPSKPVAQAAPADDEL